MTDILPDTWSVDDIVRHYDSLGIPHFQRGLVWGSDAMSLLLESVFFDTPCGPIILWEPLEPSKEGLPLAGSATLRYLIVDGQQRIRSLHAAMGRDGDESDPDLPDGEEGRGLSGDGDDAERIWCVNLSRVPGLETMLHTDLSRYPLFRLVTNPHRVRARFKYNLIPLKNFFENGDQDIVDLVKPASGTDPGDVLRKMKEIELRGRIRALMTNRVFTVKILKEDAQKQEYRLAEVVALYNRINSAGKRVESEEQAFATLVSVYPATSQWLAGVFDSIHRTADKPTDELERRTKILQRRKERNFGFKLFIRTFVQVCAYHFGYSVGSNTFSFEVVRSSSLQKRLREDADVAGRLLARTGKILEFVRDLLGKSLGCDDLQMLPDTTSLIPLFQILIRFPKLMELEVKDHTGALQSLALRLLLSSDQSQETILGHVRIINKAETADACVKALDARIASAAKLGKELSKRLESSNSLQDRYTLMLYWLLRQNGAQDLSYANLDPEKRRKMLERYGSAYEREVLIDQGVRPEKQHLVPYSFLQRVYNLDRQGRVTRHPSNNIGNITYISEALNSFETGLGSDPVDLNLEPDDNAGNHFLGSPEVKKKYIVAVRRARKAGGNDRLKARKLFEKFCDSRRKQISEAFASWVKNLAPAIAIPDRVEPEARIDPTLQDRIRQLDYSDNVEDALLACVATGRLSQKKRRNGRVPEDGLVLQLSNGADKRGFELRLQPSIIRLKLSPEAAFYSQLSELTTCCRRSMDENEWLLEASGEGAAFTVEILDRFEKVVARAHAK